MRCVGNYRRAVEYVALNDEPEDVDLDSIQGYVSVHTLAATFEKDADVIAVDVLRVRRRWLAKEAAAGREPRSFTTARVNA